MMGSRMGVAAIVMILALALAAAAASPEGGRPLPPPDAKAAASPQERGLQGILTIHSWKMTEAVGLSPAQAAQLFPRMRESFQARWQAAAKRKDLIRRLDRVSESAPPRTDRLVELLAEWRENEERLAAAQQAMEEQVRKVLSPMQQVKYLLFQERFQGDLTRLLAEVRRDQERAAAKRPGGAE